MNRPVFLVSALLLVFLAASCRENKEMPKSSCAENALTGDAGTYDPVRDSLRIDSLFDALCRLECSVAEKPDDRKRVKMLREKSLDTCAGCFYTVGRAASDPGLPEGERLVAREVAAKAAADKWTLFMKALGENEQLTCKSPVSGRILYRKELREKTVDDTLFVMVMVPVGSVVLRRQGF